MLQVATLLHAGDDGETSTTPLHSTDPLHCQMCDVQARRIRVYQLHNINTRGPLGPEVVWHTDQLHTDRDSDVVEEEEVLATPPPQIGGYISPCRPVV